MKTESVKKFTVGMIAVSALLGSGMCAADAGLVDKRGYLVDTRGNVVKNSYNQCWRTGYWIPELAIAECDPDLIKKEEPKIAIAPPAPVPIEPPKPVIKVYIAAAALFDFDESVLRPEGKKILDEQVVAIMKAHPEVEMVVVVGHADRIGTDDYNQRLSERRAAAGKDYLVQQGIAPERISAIGKGESEPDPEADTANKCKDVKGREKLIACLQPDRRVTIESEDHAPAKE
jgi:OOP family OmpA-OmpF porin